MSKKDTILWYAKTLIQTPSAHLVCKQVAPTTLTSTQDNSDIGYANGDDEEHFNDGAKDAVTAADDVIVEDNGKYANRMTTQTLLGVSMRSAAYSVPTWLL